MAALTADQEAAAAADPSAFCQESLQRGEAAAAAGQHAEALDITAACLHNVSGLAAAKRQVAVQLHELRGRCHTQLGALREAVGAYSAAIELAEAAAEVPAAAGSAPSAAGQLAQLLLARAVLYEQQERLEPALADAQAAARLRLPAAVQAAERLRKACRQAGLTAQGA